MSASYCPTKKEVSEAKPKLGIKTERFFAVEHGAYPGVYSVIHMAAYACSPMCNKWTEYSV